MERLEVEDEEAEGSSCDDLPVGNEAADFANTPSSPRVDYWRQAIHTWPRPEFEEPPEVPTEPPPPIPAVHLQLPQSGSSTSREPSPVSTTSKSRRYLPRSRDRQSLRLGLAKEEAGLSRSVEEFHFFELIGQRVQRASSDNECVEERRWSPPLTRRVSPANSQTRGVFRKLSIRRRRPLLMGNFEDAGCHSGDEAARDPKCALTARTSSLPSIAKPEIEVEDESWSRPSLEPPLISPTLGVDSNDHKPLLLPSSDEIDGMLGSSTPDSPVYPPEPPASAPAHSGSETVFAFERRRSLLQELPAIHEDAPEGDSSAETVQLRSASEHALNGNEPDDEEVENKRQSMIVIRGNPNHDDEAPLLSTLKSQSTTAIGNSCTFTRPTGRHTIDRIETNSRTHSPEVALSNGMVLRQDETKTLQLVEGSGTTRPLQVRNAEEEEKTEQPIAANGHSPDLNDRKGRIQRRKTVGPKRKTVHLRQPVDDIIPPSMFGGAVDEEDEEEAPKFSTSHPILRTVSALGVGNSDKEKKREGSVISALWNSRQTKRKPSRSSLRGTESAVPADRKRLSLIEPGRKASKNATDGLPDALSFLSSPTDNEVKNPNHANGTNGNEWPQLNKKKWEDLSLWNEEPATWSAQHSKMKVPASEEKRQNVIYEMYQTEKRHCQTLVYLQQVFQVGLVHCNVLSAAETKKLIPDVIDSLLDFHLRLLRRMRERILASTIVPKISDIIYEEFKLGEHRMAAVRAYTDFTLAHLNADERFNHYKKHSATFRLFLEKLDHFPTAKERSFKACYLRITQRLTHYNTFITRLIKCENNDEEKAMSLKALNATEEFACLVNDEHSQILLNRRFDHVSALIDRGSVGRVLGQQFTFEDLMLNGFERKILLLGNVKLSATSFSVLELTLLLFDDILVFLQNKNNVFQFFSAKSHSSVLPLSTLLIREMPRSLELTIIEPINPDMFRLCFDNKSEMQKCMAAIKSAQSRAPKYVRFAKRKFHVESKVGKNANPSAERSEEEARNEELQKWEDRLDEIFHSWMSKETLKTYMEERMGFMDEVRAHLSAFPHHSLVNDQNPLNKAREGREYSKMKTLLRSHFSDLRSFRRCELDKLVERASKLRDADICSFFDDLQELNRPNSSDSAALSSSSTDENTPSTSVRCRKPPRRARTWNYGNAEGGYQKEGVRRHTTMPKMPSVATPTIEEDQEQTQVEEQLQRLPVDLNSKCRLIATALIRENVDLRIENDRLRSENALQAMHLAAVRSRKTPFAETTEKLESLRQKQEEVQAKEVNFRREYERRMDKLRSREEELERRSTELADREHHLAEERFALSDSANSSSVSRDTSFREGSAIFDRPASFTNTSSKPATTIKVPLHLADSSKSKKRTKN